MKRKIMALVALSVMLTALLAALPVAASPGVSNYAVNWVATGYNQVVIEVQAEFCTACNPNTAGNPGHVAFVEGPPPYGYVTCTQGYPDGTYIAVRVSKGGVVLGTQKLVLQEGVNLTRGTLDIWQFVFSGLPASCGDRVTVEADMYCSWCGHWYPTPVTTTVADMVPPVVWVMEGVNPSGKNVPPAGSSTLPGSQGGINDDGFYTLFAWDACDPYPYMVICYWDPVATAPDGTTGWWVAVTDKDGNVVVCFYGTVIKLTQAPGATPIAKKMGSSKGKAGAVAWHITIPGHQVIPPGYPEALVVGYDAAGNSSWAVALVPPPPK